VLGYVYKKSINMSIFEVCYSKDQPNPHKTTKHEHIAKDIMVKKLRTPKFLTLFRSKNSFHVLEIFLNLCLSKDIFFIVSIQRKQKKNQTEMKIPFPFSSSFLLLLQMFFPFKI